jgi:hypothetical protein
MKRGHGRAPVQQYCLVAGCSAPIPSWKRLCDPCWKLLPFEQRKGIAQAGQVRAPHLVSSLSIAAATWVANNRPAAVAARRQGERE